MLSYMAIDNNQRAENRGSQLFDVLLLKKLRVYFESKFAQCV